MQSEDKLTPAEKDLDDVSEKIKPIKPQLDEIKDTLQDGSQQAQLAKAKADQAEDEAAAANKVRGTAVGVLFLYKGFV